MATLELTLPNGRRMRLTGETREAVQARAVELVAAVTDPEFGPMQLAMLTGPQEQKRERKGIISTPFGQISVGGPVGDLIRAAGNVREETSVPIALATMGAAAAPARLVAAVPRAAPLIQRAVGAITNALSPAAGAGVGGAVAGAGLEAENPDATAGDIARRAVETGAEMAGAELLGFGIGKAAQTAFAPASQLPILRALDPLSEAYKAVKAVARDLPDRARAAARRVEELLPEGVAATARDAAERLQGVASRASEIVSNLASAATGNRAPDAARAATRLRSVLGDRVERIGEALADTAPGEFVAKAFEKADQTAIGEMKRRLGAGAFQDALAVNLSNLIERASAPPGVVRLPGRQRALAAGDELVTVDAKKLDEMWSRDSLYLQRGEGNVRGYPERGVRSDAEAPEVHVSPNGVVSFIDGRHRARALIDEGVRGFTVTMDREAAENARRLRLLIDEESVLDGARLLEEWRKLPEAVRNAYPKVTQRAIENLATMGKTLRQMGRFTQSTVGGEIIDATVMPAIALAFGMKVAAPLMVAKALLAPGPLTKYLTRDKLPSEVVQTLAGQATRLGIRSEMPLPEGALTDDEFETALDRIIADPNVAGQSNRARLELAMGREDPAALRSEINALMRDPLIRQQVLGR